MELDEEDSHLCIRCNQTIIGLQNYVNHRQSSCSSSQIVKPLTKPFSTSFDFLNPHREKKMENYEDFSFGDERDDEIEMRNDKATTSDYKPYDYDFFSSLELQYMSKRDLPIVHPTSEKNFGHRILTRKATAAIMAQNGDEWIDETTAGKKDDSVYKFYNHNETETDDNSDESEPEVPKNYTRGKWKPGLRPPSDFTGGKWKPESELKIPCWNEYESSNEVTDLDKTIEVDDSNPPPSHTKGKWIPGSKITKLEYKEISENLDRDSFWCSVCSRNLASRAIYERHLKSNLHQKRIREQNDLEEAAETLPLTNLNELSTHFKQQTLEAAASIKSIEIKRVELESNDGGSDDLASKEDIKSKKFRSRSKVTCEVCNMKLPAHLLGNHLISHFHYRKMLQNPKKSYDTVLRNFHKIIIQSPFQCRPCKYYFNTQEEFMRHWNSMGHVKCVERDACEGKFQCSICKFDCGENDEMTHHLNSAKHQQVVALINRSKPIVIERLSRLTCNKCSQEFRYNIQLMKHLKTCEADTTSHFNFDGNFVCNECKKAFQSALSLQKHKIKAHKSCIYFCSECQETFKSANEAKLHRRTVQHKALASRKRMLCDPQLKTRLRKICPICNEEKLDVLELRTHILEAHPERKFSCGRCGMKFPLAQEVSRHVRDKMCKFPQPSSSKTTQSSTCTITSGHQTPSETPKTLTLMTPDSIIEFQSLENGKLVVDPALELIETSFTKILSPTPFQTASEIRSEEQVVEVSFTCKLCEFSSDSYAEFLFHEALHRVPIEQDSRIKLECQICRRMFGKQSLRDHLRQHTNERIFECTVDGCPMSFTRKANLKNHVTNVHKNDADRATPSNVCRICGKRFQSKYILEQHKFIHRSRIDTKTFQCQLPKCIYISRNATDARAHLLTHGNEKLFICTQPNCDYRGQTMEQLRSHARKHQELEFKFTCEHCDYKTKLSSHLKRHIRIHEMEEGKIYKCPHCDYACNNSENLRKHVLKTNKHPGKFLYECDYCDDELMRFKSNLMKEYQSHLQLAHDVMKKSFA